MKFDLNNKIVKLCAEGMECEGQGDKEGALQIFTTAWLEAKTDFEKFTAAHYVARHQKSIHDKLKWGETALLAALKVKDQTIKSVLPSLYLNIGKCYEDLNEFDHARNNYELALSFVDALPDDGYGSMIKGGILNGIDRIKIL